MKIAGDNAVIEYKAPSDDVQFCAQDAEFSLMLHCRFIRFSLGDKWVPDLIEFQHRQISESSFYSRFLGSKVLFGSSMNRIIFHRRNLSAENRNADGQMAVLIKRALEDEMMKLRRPADPVDQVRLAISDCILLNKNPNLLTVSAMLNVSYDRLRYLLSLKNASFRSLLIEERVKAATRLLSESTMSVGEIADYLRYSELSAFSRQFKRATGISPRSFRANGSPDG